MNEFAVNMCSKSAKNSAVISLDHTLKVLKVLWHVYTNPHMFMKQGINFLLLGSSCMKVGSDDLSILQLGNEMA
jgi:hypothetical protein